MDKWKFDKNLAPNFVDHARKHIPDYDKVIDISIDLCSEYFDNNSNIIDVGCASGETIRRLHKRGFKNIYGVDNSQAMIEVCPKDIATYRLSDTYPDDLPKMDVIICNWTLHFIKDKISYLKSLIDNLSDNGLLILSEKTSLDPLMIEKYHQFKLEKGVPAEEIKIKEQQLIDVMFINETSWYLENLRRVGFEKINIVNAHFCFNTFICRI